MRSTQRITSRITSRSSTTLTSSRSSTGAASGATTPSPLRHATPMATGDASRPPRTRLPTRLAFWLTPLAAMLWGTVGVTSQFLYQTTRANPLSIGFFRLAFAAPALALACWALLGWRGFCIPRRDLARMALIGVMSALYQACFFAAIVWLGVAVATLITLCLAPVLVTLFSVTLLGERLTRPLGLAMLGALGGVACVAVGQPGARFAADLRGVALACGSALGYAILTLAGRSLAGRYHTTQINAVAFAVGALSLAPLALATGLVVSYPAQGWALLVYLGLVPTALAYGLFITGMRATPAMVASVLTLLEPVTATFLAWLLFGERLSALGWLGAALLVGAILTLAIAHPRDSGQPAPLPPTDAPLAA